MADLTRRDVARGGLFAALGSLLFRPKIEETTWPAELDAGENEYRLNTRPHNEPILASGMWGFTGRGFPR